MPDFTLRIGGYAPQGSSHAQGLATFAETLRSTTGGRVDVDILWNILDEGRPATDLLDMVESGELAMCYFSTSYLGKRVPELNVLETPFLFRDLKHAHRCLDGGLGAALTSATEAVTGFRVLGYWDNGFRHMTNALRPIHTPADVAGMKVRLQPNAQHEAMIEAWGGIAVPVELSSGIAMIAAGEVDAQENPLANTVAYGVDKVHGHVTMTGHLYGARGLYAHPETLDGLGDNERRAVGLAARQAIETQRRTARSKEHQLRLDLTAAGVEFVDLTADEVAMFVSASVAVSARARADVGADLFELVDE